MTDTAPKLLPCPFCGGEGAKLRTDPKGAMSWVSCPECGLEAPTETGVCEGDAVEYWNRRASPSQVAPQPQAGEPVAWLRKSQSKYGLMPDEYTGDAELVEMWRGHPNTTGVIALYASPQPANPVQVTDAWLEYERTRIKGDNPQCHPYIYFQRGYEAAIAANPAQVGGSNLAERAKAVRGDLEAHNFDDVIALLDDYAAAIGAGGQAVAIISKAEAKLAAYAFDEDEETEFSREDAVFVLSALSQPHPADERVVEALRRMLSLFDEQGNLIADFAQMQGAIGNGYQAISAKEGR